MKKIKKYMKIILGTLIISIGFNLFIVPSKLIPSGMLGLTTLLSFNYGFNNAALLIIINVWTLWLIYMLYDRNKLKEYLIPSLLLPLFIYITSLIKINITNNIDELLIGIAGGFIMGIGYSLLYKEGYKTGAINILENIYNDFSKKNTKTISRSLDILLIFVTLKCYGLEKTLYSIIVIIIIRYMTTKAKIGISDNKAFYIITTKEKEIKKYLLEELNYDLTIFDAEGGFTKKKKQIIMTVVSSKDYYKVKEGINLIDPKAFISVTDNYEVINENVEINE